MNKKKNQRTRAFTYGDIQKFYEEHWGKQPLPVYSLKQIELLPDITPPAWRIHHSATYQGFGANYATLLLLEKASYDGTPYLTLANTETLPQGCTSVQEEDAEIERQHKAKQEKWEAERKQRDGSHHLSENV